MKKILFLPLAALAAWACLPAIGLEAADKKPRPGADSATRTKGKVKKIRHVVCFKFKEDATDAQIRKVEKAFAGLKKKIPEIKGLEWGVNNSPEGLNKGFTHCFIVTFADEKGREIYLPHPDHKAFVEVLKPILDDVFVIDF